MKSCIALHKKKPSETLKVNLENPYLRITGIEIPSSKKGAKETLEIIHNITIHCTKKRFKDNTQENSNLLNGQTIFSFSEFKNGVYPLDIVLCRDSRFDSIELTYESKHKIDLKIFLHLEHQNYSVEISNPYEEFKEHISDRNNSKILFSAPFGQGKTTFLNHFFEEHVSDYEVFKLYPVNYSISHNEDVFKYIKVELLFQLLGKNVTFDKESFSHLRLAPAFFKANADKILAPFLLLLPKVGKTAYDIYDKLYKLKEEYFQYHDSGKIDDEAKAITFINSVYETEGSVFEDNFYTQLIRQLLIQLKQKTGKENVLVIDDTDRMDPDHIFRILNVFAAHFDSTDYNEGNSNKFGLDKVIIVGDYSNLHKIFIHKFGLNTDFGSYINKYFSTEPFIYNNKNAIKTLLKKIRGSGKTSDIFFDTLSLILEDLLVTNNLTLREIIKFKKLSLNLLSIGLPSNVNSSVKVVRGETLQKYAHTKFFYFSLIYYLEKLGDLNTLIEKFKNCKQQIKYTHRKRDAIDLHFLVAIGFIPLVKDKDSLPGMAPKKETYVFKNSVFTFEVHTGRINNFELYQIQNLETSPESKFKFNEQDFYTILIENALKYKEYGGIGE